MIDHAMLSRLMIQCDIEPRFFISTDVMELARAIFMAGKEEATSELENTIDAVNRRYIEASAQLDMLRNIRDMKDFE